MKKLYSLIIVLALILVPFVFTCCESNKTATQVASAYSEIQTSYPLMYNQDTRQFRVEFSSAKITAAMKTSNNAIYSLGKVYLPLIHSSMGFVNSIAKESFKKSIEKFSQDEINRVYSSMMRFKDALSDFYTEKNQFDSRNKVDGTGYAQLVSSMNNFIEKALDFNMSLYNAYYNNVIVKEYNYDANNFEFTAANMQTPMDAEFYGGKLYLANILYYRYVTYYNWTNNTSGSINSFLNSSENKYLNNTISFMSILSSKAYTDSFKNTLIALRNSHNTFVTEMNKMLYSVSKYDYKGLYKSTAPEKFKGEQSQSAKDHKAFIDSFFDIRFMPFYSAVQSLS